MMIFKNRFTESKFGKMSMFVLVLLFAFADVHAQSTPCGSWPIFRGDNQLQGTSSCNLPNSLRLLWNFKTEDIIKSSPVITNEHIYAGSSDGILYCLNMNGKLVWKYTTESSIEASPLILENSVIFATLDGKIYALDATTGKLLWEYATESQVIGSANYFVSEGKYRIVVGSYDTNVYCLDAKTGNRLWMYPTGNYINGCPTVYKNKIFVGGCDSFLHVIGSDGKGMEKIELGSYVAGSASVYDGHLYIGNYDGDLISVDLSTNKLNWKVPPQQNGAAIVSSPAVNKDLVIFGSRDKAVHCLNRQTGKQVWKFSTLGHVDASPILLKDKVIVASMDGRIYLVDVATGKQLFSYEIGSSLSASPAITENHLVIAAEDGRVYMFGK